MPEILYRKWRPRSFAELAGQEHVTTTLTNALASGRIAHAYLFSGPRGTGKTTSGRLLAKALNCTNRKGGEACDECETCLSYLSGRAMDLIEMDAASNRGIEEIRSLRDKVAFAPGAGAYKVYLIDEVHMLTEAAFNALLKTLEEPPPHAVFILATTEAHKVPPTIASRCQRFDFRRAPLGATVGNLERICAGEGITCEPEALELIARAATGSHRDAVNLLDQLATSYGNDLTAEHVRAGLGLIGDERSGLLARFAITADLAGGLELIASVRDDGLDLRQFQRELVAELRALLMVKSGLPASQSGTTEEHRRELESAVANVSASRLLVALRAFGEADLKADPTSTLPLDIALAECVLNLGQAGNQAVGQEAAPTAARPSPQTAPVRPTPNPPPPSARPIQNAPPSIAPASGAPSPARPEALEGRGLVASPPLMRDDAPLSAPVTPEPALSGQEPARPDLSDSVEESTESRNAASNKPSPEQSSATTRGAEVIPVELNSARQMLRPIYDATRSRSVPLAALIGSCDIIEVSESEVVLGFKFPDHAKKAESNGNLDILTEIISITMKRPVKVVCRPQPDIRDWMQIERASSSRLAQFAVNQGARVLSSEPEEQA